MIMQARPLVPFRPLAAILMILSVLTAGPAPAMERARLVLQWTHQAQFAGYYVAREKGYYAKLDLDLEIMQGGPDRIAMECLETGRADFGSMFLATAIEHRASGMPVICLGQFVQKSALMLVARKGTGITGATDLNGRKVGIWANEFQLQPRALFRRLNIRTQLIPQTSTLDLFLRGGVAAASAMWYNEYHKLIMHGVDEDELVPFFFSDMDLNFPEDGLYCMESTWQKRPEACKALVQGTAKGWEYVFAHPHEALDIVLRNMTEARLPLNHVHQRWMLDRMRDIIQPENGTVPLGELSRRDFRRVTETLLETGFIRSAPAYEAFYKGVPHD